MGSTSDLSLRHAHLPTLIVKSVADEESTDGSSRSLTRAAQHRDSVAWIVAVDGTDCADDALSFTRGLAHETDRIVVLHVEDETAQNAIKPKYRVAAIRERYEDIRDIDVRTKSDDKNVPEGYSCEPVLVVFFYLPFNRSVSWYDRLGKPF